MDDAVIFPCSHSFGAGGYIIVFKRKHVMLVHFLLLKNRRIETSGLSVKLYGPVSTPTDLRLPHFDPRASDNVNSLRAAVAAFRREEYDNRSLKRRRDRFEEKADFSDSNHMDSPRSRSLQFSFAVADRGNKRTPQRFVGLEAIIMSQCLNGWYVVKTLDNGESIKLQNRSLAKVA